MKGLWVAASAVCIIVPYAAASEAATAWATLGLPVFEPQRVATSLDADLELPWHSGVGAITSPVAAGATAGHDPLGDNDLVSFDSGFCADGSGAEWGAIGIPTNLASLGGEYVSARLVFGTPGSVVGERAMGGVIASLVTVASVR